MKALILAVVLLPTIALVFSGCGGAGKAEERLNAGVELQDQGRLYGAILEYNEAIRLDPQLAVAYLHRGDTYQLAGRLDQALQDFDQAIRLDPQLEDSYTRPVMVFTLLSQDSDAREAVDVAVDAGVDRAFLEQYIKSLKMVR